MAPSFLVPENKTDFIDAADDPKKSLSTPVSSRALARSNYALC